MSRDTTRTVDIAYWRQYVEKALTEQLALAGIESRLAVGTGPNEVHTAFRIDEEAIRDQQINQKYIVPAMKTLIDDLQKAGKKRVAVMLDVQDVVGCPGIVIRLFPQD